MTGSDRACLVDGWLIHDVNPSVWDGHHQHQRRTPLYLDQLGESYPLSIASAEVLREIARELPQAIADYLRDIERETEATAEALQALKET